MESLFPYSHFFEILTGVYFGGIALLSFLEKDVTAKTYLKIEKRIAEGQEAKLVLGDYYKMRVNPDGNILKFGKGAFSWFISIVELKLADWIFRFANNSLKKLVKTKEQKILQKKFFPMFFFFGCFCLWVVLISALNEKHTCTKGCEQSANRFMIMYLISGFIYLLWSLFYHVKKVGRFDYLHLLANNIKISIILFIFCILSSINIFPFITNWGIDESNSQYLSLLMIFVSLLPLLIIFSSSIIIFFCWQAPIVWYQKTIKKYKKEDASEAIKEIQ